MKKVSVQCRGIGLSYGSTEVLKGLDLDIHPGEFFALLGPSGSGKSTLLRVLAGFASHQRGQLLIDGVDISAQPPWERQVGMVFQNYALWPHLSVWDNVAFGLVERKLRADVIRTKVAQALELVGLADYGPRRPHQLSGGQQQRVALARTLVIEPQVLLLDEPLSNLDKTLRVQMRQELLTMQRRLGLTTVFVTHDQEEAMTTADRMAVLDQGVLQQVGTPMALYDTPANAFVATFVGTATLWPGRAVASGVEVEGLGIVPVNAPGQTPIGAPLWVSFRPHAVALRDEAGGSGESVGEGFGEGSGEALRGEATVEAREFCGEFTRLRLRWGPHGLWVDQPHRAGLLPLQVGQRVSVRLPASAVRVFARSAASTPPG